MFLCFLMVFQWIPPMVFTPFWRDPWQNLSQMIWPALAVGYRYLGLGEPKVDAKGQLPGGGSDSVEFALDVHELRVALRIQVFEFPSPWR